MSEINYQALREAAEKATWGDWDSYKPHRGARGYEVRLSSQAIAQHVLKNNAEFIAAFNPKVALALLDERERNQQYIKSRDQENEEIALTVGKLRVELEGKDSKIANLTAERDALREGEMGDARHSNTRAAADIYFQLVEECEIPAGGSLVEYVDDMREKLEAAEKRIAELESKLNFEQWLEQQRGKIDVDCGCVSAETFMHWLRVAYEAGNHPDIPDSSEAAPGKGVHGEPIRIKPHVYRELVNRLHDTAIKCAGTQQLRERISRVLGEVITPDRHKQAEKSGLERSHLEAALNIKPGHTLGVIDAMLVHEMAKALLPLEAD